MTAAPIEPARRLSFAGCFNFRDLGGYPAAGGRRLRWRRLFRADGLTRLDTADCRQLADLGLATVIDLRTTGEIDDRGRMPEDQVRVAYHHLPLTDAVPGGREYTRYSDPEFVTARYLQLFAQGAASIGRALEILADPGALPAVFHCSAGKDRTGVLAAVVLGVLGVPDDVIVQDYALSAEALTGLFEWLKAEYSSRADEVERYAPALTSAYPGSMAAFLRSLRVEYGGFDELADALGVSAAVASLRQSLLEAP